MEDPRLGAAPEIMEIRANTIAAAALAILQDGKPRDTATLLHDGIASGALPASTTRNSLYVTLTDYITRVVARGQRPEIVEDPITKTFHVNHPVDDWPDVILPPRPRNVSAETLTTISALLRSTATGDDPAAFENAVCNAFTLMGFITTHIGGNGKPDGTLDAPLGPLGYRAILECKTAQSGVAKTVAPSEPAKFREPYGATAAVIVAPDIKREATFLAELQEHNVALWMVDDLIEAIRNDIDPYECRELFKAGPVHDRLHDLIWNRTHGPEKRAHVIRTLLQRDGFAERARFAIVRKAGVDLRYGMRQLVRGNLEARREALERFSVAVTVDHLRAVPKRVLIPLPEVDGGGDRHPTVVDRVSPEDISIELERSACHLVGPIDIAVAAASLTLSTYENTGQRRLAMTVIDEALTRMRSTLGQRGLGVRTLQDRRTSTDRRLTDALARMPFERVENVRRNNRHFRNDSTITTIASRRPSDMREQPPTPDPDAFAALSPT